MSAELDQVELEFPEYTNVIKDLKNTLKEADKMPELGEKSLEDIECMLGLLPRQSVEIFTKKLKEKYSNLQNDHRHDIDTALKDFETEIQREFLNGFEENISSGTREILKKRNEERNKTIEKAKELTRDNDQAQDGYEEELKKWEKENEFYQDADILLDNLDKTDRNVNLTNAEIHQLQSQTKTNEKVLRDQEVTINRFNTLLIELKTGLANKVSPEEVRKTMYESLVKYNIDFDLFQTIYASTEEPEGMYIVSIPSLSFITLIV